MLFDIINMSDPYTVRADDLKTLAVAILYLGEGQYAAEQLDAPEGQTPKEVPLLMFGDPSVWTQKEFGLSLEEVVASVEATKLADVLDSVLIGRAESRVEYEAAIAAMSPVEAEIYSAKWHDGRRSSLNDIGKRARRLAKAIRTKVTTEPLESAPRQVFGA